MKDLPVITAKVVERYYVCGKGFATRGALYRWLARRQIHCELCDEINRREAEYFRNSTQSSVDLYYDRYWDSSGRNGCLREILAEWNADGKTLQSAITDLSKEIKAQYEAIEVSE